MQLPWHHEEEVKDEGGIDSPLKMVEDDAARIVSSKVVTHFRAFNRYEGNVIDSMT